MLITTRKNGSGTQRSTAGMLRCFSSKLQGFVFFVFFHPLILEPSLHLLTDTHCGFQGNTGLSIKSSPIGTSVTFSCSQNVTPGTGRGGHCGNTRGASRVRLNLTEGRVPNTWPNLENNPAPPPQRLEYKTGLSEVSSATRWIIDFFLVRFFFFFKSLLISYVLRNAK